MRSTKRLQYLCNLNLLSSPIIIISLFPIALICLCFFYMSFTPLSPQAQLIIPQYSNATNSSLSSHYSTDYQKPSCDYSDGKWVHDKKGPLYSANNCKVKKSQNCISNGRPNTEYLYWRWKPNQCNIPRFEPHTFLQLVKNKHLAFVGDSLARNQFDSLICMLVATSSSSTPKYHITLRPNIDKWNFPSHNANLSFYWSPFLVEGVQLQSHKGPIYYNTMHLDHANEVWASDMEKIDMVVLSCGHWFSMSTVYYEGGSVFRCRNCPSLNNCTDIGFYGPLRKALRTSLNSIIERKLKLASKYNHRKINVIVRTYSPPHFKGDWDKGGTCSNTRPYRKGRKRLEGKEDEIRRIQIEEVENAKAKSNEFRGFIRFEIMDVTKLAMLRPDGHPGVYMNHFPFVNETSKYVQNDCLHWCLPGPIDTWNLILMEMMKKRKDHPMK